MQISRAVQWGLELGTLHRIASPIVAERRRHQVGPVLSDPVPDVAVTLVSGGQRQVLWKEVKGLELWSHWDPQDVPNVIQAIKSYGRERMQQAGQCGEPAI